MLDLKRFDENLKIFGENLKRFDGNLKWEILLIASSHRSGEASIESEKTVRSGCASSRFFSMKIRTTA